MSAEIGRASSVSSFFNSALEAVFSKETISSAKEVVTRFLSSSDYLMSVGERQVPTFFAVKEVVPHTAFIAVSAYAIAKLAFNGASNIYNSTSEIPRDSTDIHKNKIQGKFTVYSYDNPSNLQVAGSIVKGFSQIALAALAGYALYNHTENYRNVASVFLSQVWNSKSV